VGDAAKLQPGLQGDDGAGGAAPGGLGAQRDVMRA
jgi:hypothetical protein